MSEAIKRFPATAGIAIGPILFVIAILGVLAMVMSAGMGGFSGSAVTDRVTADIGTQANLIRSKINECYLQGVSTGTDNSTAAPFSSTTACEHDAYPCSDQTSGTLVENLTCPGDPLDASSAQPNLWTGPRSSNLPPPTKGFGQWYYYNGGATADAGVKGGERCIWTTPTDGKSNSGIVAGLTRVASKFSSSETNYVSSSASQKFVIFITPPINDTLSDSSPCSVP